MPIDPNFPNDVFLSYAREDADWARQLAAALTARGLVVFVDGDRLTAGERWDLQIVAELRASRQLVVLHSGYAAGSDWVRKEVEHFIAGRYYSRASSGVGAPIAVILEGSWAPFDPYQVVDEIKANGAYGAGAAALASDVWLTVTDKVDEAIRAHDSRRPIPVVLLTTTRARLEQVDADRGPGDGLSLNDLAQQLGLDPDEVLDRYGERRSDWRPFGDDGIRLLLQELEDDINDRVRPHAAGIRWEFPDEAALWDVSPADARKSVRRYEHGPCLILIDPLAFFDDQVKRWFENVLGKPLINPDGLMLVLAPASHATALVLRKHVEEMACRAFESFYEPSLHPDVRYARAVMHVGDRLDLQGWLLTGLRPVIATKAQDEPSPFTQIARTSP